MWFGEREKMQIRMQVQRLFPLPPSRQNKNVFITYVERPFERKRDIAQGVNELKLSFLEQPEGCQLS